VGRDIPNNALGHTHVVTCGPGGGTHHGGGSNPVRCIVIAESYRLDRGPEVRRSTATGWANRKLYPLARSNAANLSSSCRFKSDTTQQFIPPIVSCWTLYPCSASRVATLVAALGLGHVKTLITCLPC